MNGDGVVNSIDFCSSACYSHLRSYVHACYGVMPVRRCPGLQTRGSKACACRLSSCRPELKSLGQPRRLRSPAEDKARSAGGQQPALQAAVESLQVAVQTRPEWPKARVNLAMAYLADHRRPAALAEFRRKSRDAAALTRLHLARPHRPIPAHRPVICSAPKLEI